MGICEFITKNRYDLVVVLWIESIYCVHRTETDTYMHVSFHKFLYSIVFGLNQTCQVNLIDTTKEA